MKTKNTVSGLTTIIWNELHKNPWTAHSVVEDPFSVEWILKITDWTLEKKRR